MCVCAPLCGTRGHHYTESTQRKSTKYSETFPTQEGTEGRSQVKSAKYKKKHETTGHTVTQKIRKRKKASGSASACSATSSSSRGAADILSSQLFFFFFIELCIRRRLRAHSPLIKNAADVTAFQLRSVLGQDVGRKRSRQIAFAPVIFL